MRTSRLGRSATSGTRSAVNRAANDLTQRRIPSRCPIPRAAIETGDGALKHTGVEPSEQLRRGVVKALVTERLAWTHGRNPWAERLRPTRFLTAPAYLGVVALERRRGA